MCHIDSLGKRGPAFTLQKKERKGPYGLTISLPTIFNEEQLVQKMHLQVE